MPDSSPVGLLSLTKFDHVKQGIKDKQKKIAIQFCAEQNPASAINDQSK